jgi:hypothetical protein
MLPQLVSGGIKVEASFTDNSASHSLLLGHDTWIFILPLPLP